MFTKIYLHNNYNCPRHGYPSPLPPTNKTVEIKNYRTTRQENHDEPKLLKFFFKKYTFKMQRKTVISKRDRL